MNTVLWLLQLLLACAFLGAGLLKLTRPREKLLESQPWVEDVPDAGVKAIGALELLGAVGLVLPAAVNVAPVLVGYAAIGLALVMVGAIVTHLVRHELGAVVPGAVLLVLAAVVAFGRLGPWPL